MRPAWRRGLTVVFAGALLAAGLTYAFWPQPVPVDLAAISRGPLVVTVDEEARTRVKEIYVLSAPLAGRLMRIDRHVGDIVIAGETVIANIQPTAPAFLDLRSQSQAQANVKAAAAARALAEAELSRAKAELEFADAEWTRAKSLSERGIISRSALDRAELDVRSNRARVATAEAALEVRTYELEHARALLIGPGADGEVGPTCCVPVRAPVSGRVLRVMRESEGVVEAGARLLEIGDPADLEIVAEFLSTDAVRIEEGAPVLIEDWGGPLALNGRVHRVEPYGFTKISALGIEEQRVNVIVDIADPPEVWRSLGHGYRVELRIVIWQGDDVLRLPLGALFRHGQSWAVYVMSEGRAELRSVAIGHRNSIRAEVMRGLSEGEQVVLHPSDRVVDGTLIVARQ